MATKKTAPKGNEEKLELKQQTEAELAAKNARAKTVTIPLDEEVTQALEAMRAEVAKVARGLRPSHADLARMAILRVLDT